ncbi:MAG: hypothetical protein GQ534_06120 [Candidatus Delongbacteria bacterium]|nr:hypothetical protein [Candidatus Delongbacteria bacterium]
MNSYVRSFLFVIILLCLSTNLFGFAGGDGSPGNPYQVADPDQLYQVRFEPFANYIQIADIDFEGSPWSEENMMSWEPIGMDIDHFIGSYNGNGYTIANLYINQPSFNYMGLFGYLEGATLQNIILTDVNIIAASNTGALAGYSSMSSSIINCSTSGTVQGENEIGGLVGLNSMSTISKSYSTCSVQGVLPIGGLVGVNDNSTVTDCFARGSVNGEDMVGGLSGYSGMSNITNCYSTGTVSAIMPTFGGLIGNEDGSIIMDSYWDIETSGCASSAGGIGYPTELMKEPMTYMTWDFTTPFWSIDSLNSGYPYLAWSIPQEPVNPFAGGTGTEFDPYQIETAEQLNNVRDHLGSYFIQIANIDLGVSPWNEGEGWEPIGVMEPEEEFIGSYNGDYHTISNLFIDNQDSFYENTGLFGFCYGDINNSTIENVILDSVNITGFKSVGALIGYLMNGNISNCSSSGTIIAEESVGGLVGFAEDYSNILGSYSTCSVSSIFNMLMGESAGGLIGVLYTESSLTYCYATGSVIGEYGVGGLIGFCGNNPTITNCYSTGSITANQDYGGGLVGFSDPISESDCYWDMDTSGQNTSYVGIGKTYSEMHEQSTYETWDFTSIWNIDPQLNYGYPYLAWSTPDISTTFAGGNGSEANPYFVATPSQLDSVRNYLSSNFKQVVDIDLEEYLSIGNPGYNDGEFWQPLGNEMNMEYFTGKYDGNKKTISNLKINRDNESYVGLFSSLDTASVITDLYLFNPDSIGICGQNHVGAFVGINRGTIENCYSNCNIKGLGSLGGLVAENWGEITASCCSGHVSTVLNEVTFYSAGGLCAYNSGNITDCYATGKISAYESVGGLAAGNSGSIISSYSTGEVIGETNTGGLISSGSGCIESYWDTETSGQITSAAGIGKTSAEMKDITTFDHYWDFTTPIWKIDSGKNNGYPYLAWQNNISVNPPANISTSTDGGYFEMNCDEVPNAIAYKVYMCDEPYGTYTLISQEPINSYGCPYDDKMKFFYIVAILED